MNPILELARPDILSLQPYQHAAWEPSLERMHANEMPWRASGESRYSMMRRWPRTGGFSTALTSAVVICSIVTGASRSAVERVAGKISINR